MITYQIEVQIWEKQIQIKGYQMLVFGGKIEDQSVNSLFDGKENYSG